MSGVSTQILREEPCAIYTHCYGHSLNLACQDTIRNVKVLKDALDTTFELSTSLRKDAEFAIFWQVMKKQSELDVDEPTLPRGHKAPSRF